MNSQDVSVTTAAQAVHWDVYFDTILVTNTTTEPVYVATDGSAATTGAGADVVLPAATAAFANRQPKQPAVSSAAGSTAQQLMVPPAGHLTYVSVIAPSAPTGSAVVVISPR